SLLDPRFEAAKIRAFFIHPNFARRGIGRAILDRCEAEAAGKGFISLELMSTLPGVEFYPACDYVATDPILYDAAGVVLKFVPMKKMLSQRWRAGQNIAGLPCAFTGWSIVVRCVLLSALSGPVAQRLEKGTHNLLSFLLLRAPARDSSRTGATANDHFRRWYCQHDVNDSRRAERK